MRRHAMLWFWLLSFLLSWAAWIPLALGAAGLIARPASSINLHVYGAYGPAIAALVISFALGGLNGLQGLLSRFVVWRVKLRWYLIALFLPACLSLLTTILNLMRGGDLPDFGHPAITQLHLGTFYGDWSPWFLLAAVFIQHLLFGTAIGEELAWRGFALERVQAKAGAVRASILIGFLWVLWGLPLSWFSVGAEARWWFVPILLLGGIPASIIITSIYNNTGGSLLLVLLFNTSTKVTDLFVTPAFAPAITSVIAYWIVASLILWTGRETISGGRVFVKTEEGSTKELQPSVPGQKSEC